MDEEPATRRKVCELSNEARRSRTSFDVVWQEPGWILKLGLEIETSPARQATNCARGPTPQQVLGLSDRRGAQSVQVAAIGETALRHQDSRFPSLPSHHPACSCQHACAIERLLQAGSTSASPSLPFSTTTHCEPHSFLSHPSATYLPRRASLFLCQARLLGPSAVSRDPLASPSNLYPSATLDPPSATLFEVLPQVEADRACRMHFTTN